MSDKKISELPLASAINGADLSVLVSSGTNYQFAFSTLLQFISAGLSVGANITFGTTLPQNTSGKNGDVFVNTTAGSFAQKASGTWAVAYTLPSSGGSTDGTVLYGLGVPGSSTGNNNDTYINTGTGIFYKKSSGSWAQVFSMATGPAGPPGTNGANGTNGADGKSILHGTTDPSNLSTGTDGDFYINTVAFTFFGPKAGGVWPAGTNIAGADGADGATGAAGPGVPTGGTTGQVLSKIDGTDYHTQWSTPSGGGVSGLTANEILFGKSDGTIGQDSDLVFDSSTKSLYIGDVVAAVTPSGIISFIGDSITVGAGASTSAKRYSSLLASILGLTEDNQGRNGTTLGNTGGGGYAASSLINNLSLIPTKDSTHKYLVIEYGTNDIDIGITYLSTDFQTDYNTVVANILSKGWSGNEVMLMTSPFINADNPGSGQTTSQFNTRINAFNAVVLATASANGFMGVDINTLMVNNGSDYLSNDGTHPNDRGYAMIADYMYGLMFSDIIKSGQGLAVNKLVQLKHLGLPNIDLIADSDNGSLVGRKPDGSIGKMESLPADIRASGDMYLNGMLRQIKAVVPSGLTLNKNDILLKWKLGRIICTYDNDATWYNMLEMGDAGMNMNFNVGGTSGQFYWLVNGTQVFGISRTGLLNVMNDLQLPLNKKVVANYSGTEGGLIALAGSAITYLYNQFAAGGIADFLADGVDGQNVQMSMIHSSGRMILQNGTAHNDFRDMVGARLALNSTTDGFLMPRMTTAQRDSMAYISRVDVGGSGHGYTTATITVSGGSGSGFAATANLAGDGVNTITITNPGTGYTTPPTISITGDGTGAYGIVIPALVEGLQIYNLDTHKINTFNSIGWKQATETDA